MLLLAGFFLEENRVRMGLRSVRLTGEAQQRLVAYRWPGNVRELEHLISRAVLKALVTPAERPRMVTVEAAMLGLDSEPVIAPETPAPDVEHDPLPTAGRGSRPRWTPSSDA